MKYHFIHERGDYPILAVEEVGSVWSSSIKKVVSLADSPIFFIYENGWVRIYGLEQRHQQIVGFVWKKINQDKKYVAMVKKELKKRAEVFLEFIHSIDHLALKKLSNKDLIRLKERYRKLYHLTAPYGEPIPYFLKDKIQTVLDDYLLVKKKISMKDYEFLITPAYLSFLEREKRELNKLARIKSKKKIEIALNKHTQKYQWLHFDYASLIVDKQYFKKRLVEFKKQPPHLRSEKNLVTKKNQLIKKNKINPLVRYLIGVLDTAYFLMDYKKEVFTQGHFGITPLYQEVGRRLGISLGEVRWLSWQEAKQAMVKKRKISKKFINKRKKFSVGKSVNGKILFLESRLAKKLMADIKKDQKIDKRIKEIKGVTGSPGLVTGKIRYLKSAAEFYRIEKGEILLVSNTTPDFMPAIRLAKAIITNEGGMTCHAAIVSRELKIPCVVGTKIATRVLKDSDHVEVDADKGIIRKI